MMDFKSIFNSLTGGKKQQYFYTEPEIQKQTEIVDSLKKSGVDQGVIRAQEAHLADMQAKKQAPRNEDEYNSSLSFLKEHDPQFAQGIVDTPSLEMPRPVEPVPPMPSGSGDGKTSSSLSLSAKGPGMGGGADFPLGDQSNEDQAKRDALSKQQRADQIKQLFPQALAGLGDVLTAGGAPYGTKQTNALDKTIDIADKGRKEGTEKLEKRFLTDPNSGASKIAQSAAARLLGKKPEELSGLSLQQIEKAFPLWKEALNNEQAKELKMMQMEAIKAQKDIAQSTKDDHFKEKHIQQIRQNLTSHKSFGNLQEMNSKFAQMSNAAKNPTAYGDLTIMFSFMKALDPTSVVREGEQDRFVATASLPQAMANKLNKLASGKSLSPAQRAEVVNIAKEIRGTALEGFKTAAKPSIEQAKRLQYDLKEIDPMFEEEAAPAGKTVAKKQYSKSADKTKIIYSDGSEEIVDGRK